MTNDFTQEEEARYWQKQAYRFEDKYQKLRVELAYEKQKSSKLLEALREAKSIIRTWHGMGAPKGVEKSMWELYDENAPEMKRINSAINEYEK